MTRSEAMQKAATRSQTTRNTLYVVLRTDHPYYMGQDYYYVIPAPEKHAWTPGETLVEAFTDGEISVPL